MITFGVLGLVHVAIASPFITRLVNLFGLHIG